MNGPISTDRCITIIFKDLRIGKIDLGFVHFLQKFLECFKFYSTVFIQIILQDTSDLYFLQNLCCCRYFFYFFNLEEGDTYFKINTPASPSNFLINKLKVFNTGKM